MDDRRSLVPVDKTPTVNWMTFLIARPNFKLGASNKLRDGFSDAYLSITGPHAKENFRQLQGWHEAQVMAALSAPCTGSSARTGRRARSSSGAARPRRIERPGRSSTPGS